MASDGNNAQVLQSGALQCRNNLCHRQKAFAPTHQKADAFVFVPAEELAAFLFIVLNHKLLAHGNARSLNVGSSSELVTQQLVGDKVGIHAVANPPAVNRKVGHYGAEPELGMLLFVIADDACRCGVRGDYRVRLHAAQVAATQSCQETV